MHDVAVVGGGIAGLATAARLQRCGLSTIVFEAHRRPGGCAGFYQRKGFSFDVGATTLVDFEPDGVGGELLNAIGMESLDRELLPGYVVWLPDRTVTLCRDRRLWCAERILKLGGSDAHRRFWRFMDQLADVFWNASRRGVRLPLRCPADLTRAARAVGPFNLSLVRFLTWTLGDALRAYRLRDDVPLVALLGMLVEDTLHARVDDAPLINASLGITIRGAGLSRARGGMRGFWTKFVSRYRDLGGTLKISCPVLGITGGEGLFTLATRQGEYTARQVVSALPIELTAKLAPAAVQRNLMPYVNRDHKSRGSAVVVCLGVPEEETDCHQFTHHQLLQDYAAEFGNGNNMFISVSAPDDTESAPPGCRAVMISTHCELSDWQSLTVTEYVQKKQQIGERLVQFGRRVYPQLGSRPIVFEVGTPRTFERFTGRCDGAVGGVRQTLGNSNQRSIHHNSGMPGFWLVGDTTWPGLGTVACVLGSRIVAESVIDRARRLRRLSAGP